jgi:hypothetical protein
MHSKKAALIVFYIATRTVSIPTIGIHHDNDLDLFIASFTASLTSLATCSSIPRVLARSDDQVRRKE